jgi:hypothetical protein
MRDLQISQSAQVSTTALIFLSGSFLSMQAFPDLNPYPVQEHQSGERHYRPLTHLFTGRFSKVVPKAFLQCQT